MNHIEFYTGRNEVIKAADKEFLVVNTVVNTDGAQLDKWRVSVLDTRPVEEMRKELRTIYNNVEPIA